MVRCSPSASPIRTSRLPSPPTASLPSFASCASRRRRRRPPSAIRWQLHGLPDVFTNAVTSTAPSSLSFRAVSPLHSAEIRASCPPESFVGYVYRDPEGWDAYVAQSDIASCEVALSSRRHPFRSWRSVGRLTAGNAAAIEFHSPEPLPGVRYIPWDETTPRRKECS